MPLLRSRAGELGEEPVVVHVKLETLKNTTLEHVWFNTKNGGVLDIDLAADQLIDLIAFTTDKKEERITPDQARNVMSAAAYLGMDDRVDELQKLLKKGDPQVSCPAWRSEPKRLTSLLGLKSIRD